MNYLKLSTIILLLFSFTIISCSDDDSPRDFRLDFEGDYEVEEIDVTIYEGAEDTTFTDLDIDPEITLEIDTELDADEMRVEIEDFLEDLFKETLAQLGLPVTVSIDFDDEDDLIAEISAAGDLEIEDIEFDAELATPGNTPVTWTCELQISGEIVDSEMSFEYEIDIVSTGGTATFGGEGTAAQ